MNQTQTQQTTREEMFAVVTGMMTHFDCRDVEDLIRSRRRWDDNTRTRRIIRQTFEGGDISIEEFNAINQPTNS